MKRYMSMWTVLVLMFVASAVLFASSTYAADTNTVAKIVKRRNVALGSKVRKIRSLKVSSKPSIVWAETATTNDQGQVTRILTGTKKDGSTITVCPLYNGWEVPFEFRQKILTIPEEERKYLVSMGPEKRTDMKGSGDRPNVPVPAGTDTIQTDEIRVIDLRW